MSGWRQVHWPAKIFLPSYSLGAGGGLQLDLRFLAVFARNPGAEKNPRRNSVNLSLSIGPVISLIAGILILAIPRLLNYIVAVYLIVIGLVGLFGVGSLRI